MSGGQFMTVLIVAIVMVASIFKAKHRRSPGLDMVEHLRGDARATPRHYAPKCSS